MKPVIIEDGVWNIAREERVGYHEFIYCYEGKMRLSYNGHKVDMTKNCCAIILCNKTLKIVSKSDDFECKVLYIDELLMRQSGPQNPYVIQATLSLHADPVMELDENAQSLCKALFENFKMRLEAIQHMFYEDILRTSARMLMLDMFDFHARLHQVDTMSAGSAKIMSRFIEMLENKEYRKNREVAYYAKKLCVVPKYLSEVSNRVSGFSASYWINKYTSQDISEQLSQKKLSVTEVTKLFNFTSTSYFNRYVKRSLGVYPSELRNK